MFIEISNTKEEYSLKDEESIFLIYKWITDNIWYDCSGNGGVETPATIYKSRTGTSKGISNLFKIMSDYMGIKSDTISGYLKKTIKDDELLQIIEYDWNYVVINSTYYLIDVSSAIGVCEGNIFTKNYQEFYFATNPEFFIRSHFPKENKWQLLDNIVTKEQFISMAFTTHFYYLFGFKTIYPDINIINGEKKTEFIFTFENKKIKPEVIGIGLNSELEAKEMNYTEYLFTEEKMKLTFDLSNQDINYFYIAVQQYVPLEGYINLTGVVLYKINHSKKINELFKYPKNNKNMFLNFY